MRGAVSESLQETFDLLALHHGSNAEHVRDEFDRIRSSLDNRLGGIALPGVTESEAAIRRRQLIGRCVDVLIHPFGKSFRVDNQADVRWLQSSVAWLKPGGRPFYIIGEATRGRTTEMLWHEVKSDPGQAKSDLFVVEMPKKTYEKWRGPAKSNLLAPTELSPEEVNRLCDPESEDYILRHTYRTDDTLYATRSWIGALSFIDGAISTVSGKAYLKIKESLPAAVYSPTLDRLNVANQISYLALAFGKGDELGEVIEKYAADLRQTDQLELFNGEE